MSNLIEHAKEEFKILGYKPLEENPEDDPNKWIQENVLELLEVFSKQGHSGSSAPFCVDYFKRLAAFEPLSPIKCDDSEWVEAGEGMFQNKRLSSVFKDGIKGKPYYLDAIIWKTEKGHTYTGSAIIRAEGKKCDGTIVKSRQFIKLPFYPKSFYVAVTEVEVSKDSWEFYLDDLNQLPFQLAQEYYDLAIINLRQCVKDSVPNGLTVEEIKNVIENWLFYGESPLTHNKAIAIATAIHAAQERKGKDDHVA